MTTHLKTLSLIIAFSAPLTASKPASAQFEALRKFARGAEEPVNQIAYFKIKGAVAETPSAMPSLFGNEPPVSLKSLLARFKEARQDKHVLAIVIDLQQAALGIAQLEEIHASLRKFAAVDKDVFLHADSLSTIPYAAATGASHISIVPTGDVWLTGIYGERPYIRGTLDMIGAYPDIERCGDFKSAGETLTRTGPSEEAERMINWLLDGLYESLVATIAKGRNLSPAKVRSLIDNGPYSAEEALRVGLIDSVQHKQDFIAGLKKRYGQDIDIVTDYAEDDSLKMPDDNFFAMFEFMMKLFNPSEKEHTEPSVAIVYVEGAIQTGEGERSPFGSPSGAFSTTIRRALDKAAADDTVKAVVLRVDSPGGSALASEIILDATRRVAAQKPLVVSMGNVAGSGGYYVTCAADTLFADPGTITASIGVLGGKIVTTGMWNKLGVSWHPVQRGAMAGILGTAQPFTEKERAKIVHYMNTVYDVFKKHVVDARGKKLAKPIDEIAGGRVFTGAQALKLGLVDKMGGLDDAIKFAANRAGLGEYEVRVIPEPKSILDFFGGGQQDDEFTSLSGRAHSALANLPLVRDALATISAVDPLRTAAILRALQRVELIHNEGVVMMMPAELLVR